MLNLTAIALAAEGREWPINMQTKWRPKIEFLVPPDEISDVSIQRLNRLLEILAEYYPDARPLTDLGIGTREKTQILIKAEQLVIEAI